MILIPHTSPPPAHRSRSSDVSRFYVVGASSKKLQRAKYFLESCVICADMDPMFQSRDEVYIFEVNQSLDLAVGCFDDLPHTL